MLMDDGVDMSCVGGREPVKKSAPSDDERVNDDTAESRRAAEEQRAAAAAAREDRWPRCLANMVILNLVQLLKYLLLMLAMMHIILAPYMAPRLKIERAIMSLVAIFDTH